MTEIMNFDEDTCSFVMRKRFSTIVFTVRRYLDENFPVLTVSTYSRSGKHLLYARAYEIRRTRSEIGPDDLLVYPVALRVEDVGSFKKHRAGHGIFGTWMSWRNLWTGLFAAGITAAELTRGLMPWGRLAEMTPLSGGWTFMTGTPAIPAEEPCLN